MLYRPVHPHAHLFAQTCLHARRHTHQAYSHRHTHTPPLTDTCAQGPGATTSYHRPAVTFLCMVTVEGRSPGELAVQTLDFGSLQGHLLLQLGHLSLKEQQRVPGSSEGRPDYDGVPQASHRPGPMGPRACWAVRDRSSRGEQLGTLTGLSTRGRSAP